MLIRYWTDWVLRTLNFDRWGECGPLENYMHTAMAYTCYDQGVKEFSGINRLLSQIYQRFWTYSKTFDWFTQKKCIHMAWRSHCCIWPVEGCYDFSSSITLPDFSQEFVVETDASNSSIGAILLQKGKPQAFFSKALAPKHQGLSVYEKKMLAIVNAI